uniref:Chromosome 11 open reading frame 68 n=1 Tax=Nothobranchius korthausae TaxID=1143690 RepID=A0A1A8G7N4_9TELE
MMEGEGAPEDGAGEAPFTAEAFAAEAMAADNDPWIVFDSRRTPRSEFEGWLESNRPSQVYRFGAEEGSGCRVGWIAVLGPDHCPGGGDVMGLQESWEKLLASSRPVTFQTVKELALNHGVLTGKWLMHLDSGFKVDHAWECVARATLEGKISTVKVSPFNPKAEGRQVICAYNHNFTDESEVMRLDSVIRATGVKCPLSYKPDVYSYLGIYRNNRWKLCPTIYESKFDLECVPRRSHIINKVTSLEVT